MYSIQEALNNAIDGQPSANRSIQGAMNYLADPANTPSQHTTQEAANYVAGLGYSSTRSIQEALNLKVYGDLFAGYTIQEAANNLMASPPSPPPPAIFGANLTALYTADKSLSGAAFDGATRYGQIMSWDTFYDWGNHAIAFDVTFTYNGADGIIVCNDQYNTPTNSRGFTLQVASGKVLLFSGWLSSSAYAQFICPTALTSGSQYRFQITVDPTQSTWAACASNAFLNGTPFTPTINSAGTTFVGHVWSNSSAQPVLMGKMTWTATPSWYTGVVANVAIADVTASTSRTYNFKYSELISYPAETPAANGFTWYRTATNASINGVYQLTDQSGNGYHLQDTATVPSTYRSRPALLKNDFAGSFPAVKFSEYDDTFLGAEFGRTDAAQTVIHLLAYTSTTVANKGGGYLGGVISMSGFNASHGMRFIPCVDATGILQRGFGVGNDTHNNVNVANMIGNVATMIGATVTTNSDTPVVYLGGGQPTVNTPTAGGRTSATGLIIGRPANYASHDLGGDFKLYGTIVVNRAATQAEMQKVQQWFAYYMKCKNTVLLDGNSITAGAYVDGNAGLAGNVLVDGLADQIGLQSGSNNTFWFNFSVSSSTTAIVLARQAAGINMAGNPNTKNIVRMWEGTNDLGTSHLSAASIEANYSIYFSSIKTAIPGIKCVTTTTPPADTYITGADETSRQSLNTWLLANSLGLDAVVDVRLDPYVGANSSNASYWNPDKVHPNKYGAFLLAQYEAPTIASFLAAPSTPTSIFGANLGAWYKFKNYTGSGGYVTAWADSSANGYNLAQATPGNQPQDGNAKKATFARANDYLQATADCPAIYYTSDFTWAGKIRVTAFGTSGCVIFSVGESDNLKGWGLGWDITHPYKPGILIYGSYFLGCGAAIAQNKIVDLAVSVSGGTATFYLGNNDGTYSQLGSPVVLSPIPTAPTSTSPATFGQIATGLGFTASYGTYGDYYDMFMAQGASTPAQLSQIFKYLNSLAI